jgi:DNA-binding NarL/FixJ family response regulator
LSSDLLKLPQVPEGLKVFLDQGSDHSGEFEHQGAIWEIHGGWFNVPGVPSRAYGVLLVDVTEVRAAQIKLALQDKSLVVLQERERLARELHDSLGQQLAFLNLSAQTLHKTISQGRRENSLSGLLKLAEVARKANEEVRYFIQASSTRMPRGTFAAALNDLVRRFRQTYEFRVELEIEPSLDEDFVPRSCHREVLMIVQEAVTNARKHARVEAVLVRVLTVSEQVRIAVVDSGCGFSHLNKEMGFGLGIMEDRARLAGIALHIESSPGAGTRVLLDIPSAMEPAATTAAHGTAPRLLLADDNELFAEGLKERLLIEGYDVVGLARDGEEAVRLCQTLQPDCLLLDIQMPGLDGLGAAATIHRNLPQTKIVMLTVSASDEDLFEALRVGASAYLLKSFESDELFEVIDSVLRGETSLTADMAARILEEGESGTNGSARKELSERQGEILGLVAYGMTYKEIGVRLNLTERTIKYHMGEILERLHVKTRADATRVFLERKNLEKYS